MNNANPVLDAMVTADEVLARWLHSMAERLIGARLMLDVDGVDTNAGDVLAEVIVEMRSVARLLLGARRDNYREDHD
jgi:hypothetical protein